MRRARFDGVGLLADTTTAAISAAAVALFHGPTWAWVLTFVVVWNLWRAAAWSRR